MDLSIYKYLFLAALILVSIISIFLIIGLNKAKKDEDKRISIQKENSETLKEILSVLKSINNLKDDSSKENG